MPPPQLQHLISTPCRRTDGDGPQDDGSPPLNVNFNLKQALGEYVGFVTFVGVVLLCVWLYTRAPERRWHYFRSCCRFPKVWRRSAPLPPAPPSRPQSLITQRPVPNNGTELQEGVGSGSDGSNYNGAGIEEPPSGITEEERRIMVEIQLPRMVPAADDPEQNPPNRILIAPLFERKNTRTAEGNHESYPIATEARPATEAIAGSTVRDLGAETNETRCESSAESKLKTSHAADGEDMKMASSGPMDGLILRKSDRHERKRHEGENCAICGGNRGTSCVSAEVLEGSVKALARKSNRSAEEAGVQARKNSTAGNDTAIRKVSSEKEKAHRNFSIPTNMGVKKEDRKDSRVVGFEYESEIF